MAASLSLTRRLPARIDRVFEACTRPDLIARWLVCNVDATGVVTSELRVGGTYRIDIRRGDEVIGDARGEYLAIEAPRRLVFTWRSDAGRVRDSIVTIELRALGDETELTLHHAIDPDTDVGRAHGRGWTTSLDALHRVLEGPP